MARLSSWVSRGLSSRYGGRSVASVVGWVLATALVCGLVQFMAFPGDDDASMPGSLGLSIVFMVLVVVVAFKESRVIQRACEDRAPGRFRGHRVGWDFTLVGMLCLASVSSIVRASEPVDLIMGTVQAFAACLAVVSILWRLSPVDEDGSVERP